MSASRSNACTQAHSGESPARPPASSFHATCWFPPLPRSGKAIKEVSSLPTRWRSSWSPVPGQSVSSGAELFLQYLYCAILFRKAHVSSSPVSWYICFCREEIQRGRGRSLPACCFAGIRNPAQSHRRRPAQSPDRRRSPQTGRRRGSRRRHHPSCCRQSRRCPQESQC